ncbi:MAG TPA: hypothetical protein VE992_05240 [Solirubrobacteraceae bacterium]|nr:hypothetical protein [Solirubrobacteraceae bacterium]
MISSRRRQGIGGGALLALGLLTGTVVVVAGSAVLAALLDAAAAAPAPCATPPAATAAIAIGPPGHGTVVGATEYGGPGDPSSGVVGASGMNLLAHPDSYAELGGTTFQTARMMGGLPYMTPLRITWAAHSAIAYKRDFGLGGGPIDGHPRVIDLWWQLAGRLGIPYENGLWSGTVRLERPPSTGAGSVLGQVPATAPPASGAGAPGPASGARAGGDACAAGPPTAVALTPGERAVLLPSGLAAAPAAAPAAVKAMIAAGNQIAGKPYLYGGGHGLPLSEIAPAYDCSSSAEHLLYGAGLLPAGYGGPSGQLESFGAPGPGRWVTIYANPDHVFLYVAGLRWDTADAAGPGDGSAGIGWHPLIRSSAGFVARHPAGL